MIEIDGSCGEGGGQILRTSLTLAALTGQAVRLRNIRANRRKPGLMRQHLTCAEAIAEITGGALAGAELNSQELTFTPGSIRAGEYRFVVGSAGSALLIAQTVLPCLLCADGVSRVVIEGGTHASNAPIFDFFSRVYLPCLRRMGAELTASLDRAGFYPAGGGRITLEIQPVQNWNRLEIMESGMLRSARLTVLQSGIAPQIAEDEIRFCRNALESAEKFRTEIREVPSPGSGNVMFAELEFEQITELFSVCGEIGVSRRKVAEQVAKLVNHYRAAQVPVGSFLADQLLVPMAIGAGGKFLTLPPSRHTQTNIHVIKRFLPVQIITKNRENGQFIIEVLK